MGETERDGDGEFSRKVSDERILDAMRENPAPVVTATELADVLPIGRRAVRERLLAFEERGLVGRKEAGARAVVWWVTDSPTPARDAESLADRLGGFGMLAGEAGDEFADAVAHAREEMNEDLEEREERTDALSGE